MICLHGGQRDDGEVRLEREQLVGVGADEQVAREQAVPRQLSDDPHTQPVARVGTGKHVLGVHLVGRDELLHPAHQSVEFVGGDWLVARVPPDRVLAGRLSDEELVLGRAPSVLAGLSRQGAGGHDRGFASPHRVLVKGRRAQVAAFDGNLGPRSHLFPE